MMKSEEFWKPSDSFVITHNLVGRIYDMLYFFSVFKDREESIEEIEKEIIRNLEIIEEVETFAKYFEVKLKNKKKKKKISIELACNLKNLINDLNMLKQYLEKELKES